MTTNISIPANLRPRDGRFGCGPAKVRSESVFNLAAASSWLGTSHRQAPVRNLVGELQSKLSTLFSLPAGYEVVLGVGGATLFWDIACFALIEEKSQHTVFGEFSSKFASAARNAPHIGEPTVIEAPPGSRSMPVAEDGVDTYCLIHNETSTGVFQPPVRPSSEGIVVVDGTSAAGGIEFDPNLADVYYFAPQKCFSSDGGLWLALMSPAAIERAEKIAADGRWIPDALSLTTAIDNSRKKQTYNTPALATLFLMLETTNWMLENGGLAWAAGRSATSTSTVYDWADKSEFATPYAAEVAFRSPVVATIDFDDRVNAAEVAGVLRDNGIVDVEPYRKLNRNQLRLGLYPAVDPEDAERLVTSIDFVVEQLSP